MASNEFNQLWEHIDKKAPIAQWAIVTISFASSGVDVEVPHSLQPAAAEGVDYQLLRSTSPMVLYHDGSPTRLSWQPTYIYLRASVAGTADILVSVADDGGARVLPMDN